LRLAPIGYGLPLFTELTAYPFLGNPYGSGRIFIH
jgi:hypothetical protein